MALKVAYYNGEYMEYMQKIEISGTGEIDKVKGIALCLGYLVIDGGFQDSIEMIDSTGEYQGYYDPDDNSEAYFRFNNLGGEKWISNL